MARGKSICKTLKAVRQRIADANGIVYKPQPCDYQGDCLGTCPACEAEVRYLENQLAVIRRKGVAATVVGVAMGLGSLSPAAAYAQSDCCSQNGHEKKTGKDCCEKKDKDDNARTLRGKVAPHTVKMGKPIKIHGVVLDFQGVPVGNAEIVWNGDVIAHTTPEGVFTGKVPAGETIYIKTREYEPGSVVVTKENAKALEVKLHPMMPMGIMPMRYEPTSEPVE